MSFVFENSFPVKNSRPIIPLLYQCKKEQRRASRPVDALVQPLDQASTDGSALIDMQEIQERGRIIEGLEQILVVLDHLAGACPRLRQF